MKKSYITLALAILSLTTFFSCSKDELNSTSVFENGMGTNKSEATIFDEWLLKNYVLDYNITFNYYYIDKESNQSYNVTPAEFDKAQALAVLVKHVWIDAYTEAQAKSLAKKAGVDLNDGSAEAAKIQEEAKSFLRTYSPRVIQLIGSYEWNSNNSQVMGTAEQGMKVLLFGVNELDLDTPYFVSDNPYADKAARPIDMNYWFFHTMHHEFCHILTQTKEYSTEFRTISEGKFHATDWINVKDRKAATEGFVTGYASGEYNEDFAETYAMYISYNAEGWAKIIETAGEEGAKTINRKVAIVRDYFQETWNIDIDEMRDIVQRRCAEATKMNLRNIDFSK